MFELQTSTSSGSETISSTETRTSSDDAAVMMLCMTSLRGEVEEDEDAVLSLGGEGVAAMDESSVFGSVLRVFDG